MTLVYKTIKTQYFLRSWNTVTPLLHYYCKSDGAKTTIAETIRQVANKPGNREQPTTTSTVA